MQAARVNFLIMIRSMVSFLTVVSLWCGATRIDGAEQVSRWHGVLGYPQGVGVSYEKEITSGWGIDLGVSYGQAAHPQGDFTLAGLASHIVYYLDDYHIQVFAGLGLMQVEVRKTINHVSSSSATDIKSQIWQDVAFSQIGLHSLWYLSSGGWGLFSGLSYTIPIWWQTTFRNDLAQQPGYIQKNILQDDSYWSQRQDLKRWSRTLSGFDTVQIYLIGITLMVPES